MRQVVLDTETTGTSTKDGHRIIEIGCIELVNRKVTGNDYHVYINPQRDIERQAQDVHGITDAFLADKPLFEDIVQGLVEYLQGSELIIHNAPFDVGFLNYELKLCQKQYGQIEHYCNILDTLSMARHEHPGQRNSLDALCRRYSIDNSSRDLHGALIDADLLAQVYLAMTGGQVAMSLEEELSMAADQDSSMSSSKLTGFSTPLVQPSEAEQQYHRQYLEWMREQYNACIWHESDGTQTIQETT